MLMYTFSKYEVDLKEIYFQSDVYFVEVSSGVYYVKKSRWNISHNSFVSEHEAIKALNLYRKVSIERLDGATIVSNHNFQVQ